MPAVAAVDGAFMPRIPIMAIPHPWVLWSVTAMSLLIVQGPGVAPVALSGSVPSSCAGHAVDVVHCADAGALVDALRAADRDDVALVLLEPGADPACRGQLQALRGTLDALPAPYIELHTDRSGELEPWLHPQHAPLAVVMTPNDAARGYAMSLGIAARCLSTSAIAVPALAA